MASLHSQYASVSSSSILIVSKADSSFSGRSASRSFSPWMHSAQFRLSGPLKMSSHKRRGNVIVLASDESSEKNVPLWRKELTSLEDPAGENSALKDGFLQNSAMEEDIARLQKKRDLEKRIENFNRTGDATVGEKTAGDGMVKTVIEKVLVADFFFILFILAWLVAGLGERSFLESTRLIDAWLPLWTTVFQPALGVFMAGAIVSAVSGFLSKSGKQ
ncbi:hypothetical protein M758_3G015600 [Ceratodon purpureus]|nr:hypothetical protein M758_3G015600 [Ceratodon purpureus]